MKNIYFKEKKMNMFRCCLGARSQNSMIENRFQPVQNTGKSNSSPAEVQVLNNTFQTETRSSRIVKEPSTVVAPLNSDHFSAVSSAAGGHCSKSAGSARVDMTHIESFDRATQVKQHPQQYDLGKTL